ncbi:hypothetical protein IGI04_025973 [Brassica rapa subsp. trilocularis]|uniref:Uncharacterized protein n=1 Tax=Brassica rapa subsp. trilocularis TaxID=1813537 RepID=A0ABQ7KX89_BRACM|nr:hypothetical protein IGI04_025973 [Brassica rapa subsp. trilocularis]
MLLRNPPSMFSDWVDLHSSLLLACSVFELQKHQEACCSIKLYSGLKPQSTSFLTKWATEFEYELNPGKASWSRVKMMPIGTPTETERKTLGNSLP